MDRKTFILNFKAVYGAGKWTIPFSNSTPLRHWHLAFRIVWWAFLPLTSSIPSNLGVCFCCLQPPFSFHCPCHWGLGLKQLCSCPCLPLCWLPLTTIFPSLQISVKYTSSSASQDSLALQSASSADFFLILSTFRASHTQSPLPRSTSHPPARVKHPSPVQEGWLKCHGMLLILSLKEDLPCFGELLLGAILTSL